MRQKSTTVRSRPQSAAIALSAALVALPVCNVLADVTLPPVKVGAGVRTSFTHYDPDFGAETDDFDVNSARVYLSGKATEQIGLTFNTDYNAVTEDLVVMDAFAAFEFSEQFNIWAGRFLPPSDRSNLYGPYYANHWGVYQDGIQDGYPFESVGRDDGIAYWGRFGITKVSFGVFDVPSLKGSSDVLYAGRVQLDFWDPEDGYFLNSTYYGDKDLLAIGVAAQTASGDNAYTVDFLLEKKLGGGGVVTVESQYAKYDGLGGYGAPAIGEDAYKESDGAYVLGAYLFPAEVGIGKFQVLGKYAQTSYDYFGGGNVDGDTIELNLNYIINAFNARIALFYIDKSFDPDVGADSKQLGLGLQVQM
ncbi:MAG TPA: porin [Povalibacter sp.]|jgi:Phosphate-selective porin O and P